MFKKALAITILLLSYSFSLLSSFATQSAQEPWDDGLEASTRE